MSVVHEEKMQEVLSSGKNREESSIIVKKHFSKHGYRHPECKTCRWYGRHAGFAHEKHCPIFNKETKTEPQGIEQKIGSEKSTKIVKPERIWEPDQDAEEFERLNKLSEDHTTKMKEKKSNP